MKKYFTKEGMQVANKHVESCSPPLAIREVQSKTIMRDDYIPIRRTRIFKKKSENIKHW